MLITQRQRQILNKIVQEYIDTAQPVSSQLVERKCNLSVCPATVRIEMQRLTDSGFLFQPHTSAGRVPTDKGYRFFVDEILEGGIVGSSEFLEVKKVLEEDDVFKLALELTRSLSRASSSFAVSYFWEEDLFFKEGWEQLLKEPEFESKELVSDFTSLLDNLKKTIESLDINSGVNVYIGKENPAKAAEDFGMVLARCRFPQEKEGVVSILGPKRMTYERNINLMNSLLKTLERF